MGGAKVEEALLYHHAILHSLRFLPLQQDTALELYKSTTPWNNETGVWSVEYANDQGSGPHLCYRINSRKLEDAIGVKQYTPTTIMQIIKEYRERSTLWQAIEQEITTPKISRQRTTLAPSRLVPAQLHLFAKIAIQEYFRHMQGKWENHLPEFIDGSVRELQDPGQQPGTNIVYLEAWKMHPERSKQ